MTSVRCFVISAMLAVAPALVSAAPDTSLRPQARATTSENVPPVSTPQAHLQVASSAPIAPIVTRPVARPVSQPVPAVARVSQAGAAQGAFLIEPAVLVRSVRPSPRPPAIVQKAMARVAEERAGSAGGIKGVQGEEVAEVEGRGACGIRKPLRVTAVSGVQLNPPALMDIPTARALKDWVDNGLKPAVGNMGGGVQSMRVAAHYVCRTRNHQPGAKLSEHSFGKAIDFSSFTLRNGEQIVLARDWGRGNKGRALREMHRAACGPFGTVLGPESDRWHRDHFHFDTARHGNGPYCR